MAFSWRRKFGLQAAELVNFVPLERVPRRISVLPVEVPVSHIMDAIKALQVQVHAISNEFQASLLPRLQEEIVKMAQLISHERMQECVVEQPVAVAVLLVVLPIKAEGCCAAAFASRAHPRTHRQVREDFVAVVHHEHDQERIGAESAYPRASISGRDRRGGIGPDGTSAATDR